MARALTTYHQKRDFARTAEPRGKKARRKGRDFVVQKHAARRLHYDFRLEHGGVLLSWAVPKGPSLDPGVKRLAVQTEDHPVEYGDFEGAIPKGEYGGGTVIVWDRGSWEPTGDPDAMYEKGHLEFELHGEKLRGGFHLVRTRSRGPKAGAKDGSSNWLLIKRADADARPGSDDDIVEGRPESVATGRSLSDVAESPARVWSSKAKADAKLVAKAAKAPRARSAKPKPVRLAAAPGMRRAALPDFVPPQLATLVDAAPAGAEWLHEIKLDGYRLLARFQHGRVQLSSRRGNDWTTRLPSVVAALEQLPIASGLLDGEVVVLGSNGVSDFQRLQNSLEAGKDDACTYFAFDALFLDGLDLRALPLSKRKALLEQRFAARQGDAGVRFSAHVAGGGAEFFERACELGLEGSIAKRADAPYVSGRSKSWLKVKCTKRQEFIIVGYTDPGGSRSHLGALLLGVQEADRLVYAGKVGTGFTVASLRELHQQLAPLERPTPALDNPLVGAARRGVHWLEPRLVAEIEFAERTREGMVRHASFRGLRQDKPAADVRAEEPAASPTAVPTLDPARISLTHPERVLYPEQGFTKRDLALYYARVSARMLPHVIGRPLMLVRCPEGAAGQCFHQKHPSRGMLSAVERVLLPEKKGSKEHLMIRDVEGLIGVVQMGALELHTWGCQAERVEYPDQLVFDLDPDVSLQWERVIEAALKIRKNLSALGLTGFLKTTGGKGLHVVVPVEPNLPWDAAKQFTKSFVEVLVRAEPSKYLMVMTKQKRAGKIFLDYLRNGRGATAVAAYSTRVRSGAPVSTPIAWDELTTSLRPERFDLRSVPERLMTLEQDPWQDFEAARAPLPT